MIARQVLYLTKNRQALVSAEDPGRHTLAYVPGQEISRDHEALLIKPAPIVETKIVPRAQTKEE